MDDQIGTAGSLSENIPMRKPIVVESFDLLSDEISALEVAADDLLLKLMAVCNPTTIEENSSLTVEQARPRMDEITEIRKAAMAERIDNLRTRIMFLSNRIKIFRDALEI